ncbi:tail fiber domain-containing protein, partial [Akkermansiaceae bacterium]|nr:tail fiber domain-containing protein [Akkermansiaceae bacterium]MDB4658807.1 tail fiber domain-containing protein [bacterium]MDB4723604.1 tail fiber domain-containing protein [Akkermansiaceae bacterium]MDC0320643.1 tail fiber domain-containing protein [Akkermansiaceae bacterium]
SALNLKAPLASPTFTGTVSGITKSMVGLGSVDNTADANKPVSAEQQAALNLKADAAAMETALAGKQVAGDYVTLVDGMVPVGQLPLTLDKITAAPVLPVIAWGGNDFGQTTVPSLVNVAGIAARESHSLVLLNDGTVVTWGNGAAVPANLEPVVAIAAGSSHDIAIKSDGSVVAWGNNTYGQTSVPSGITTAIHAAAGEKHSLILLSTGAVTAWGNNSFGQSTVPVAASTNVTAIAAGYDHSLALKADGTVVAWGRSDANQISVPVGLSNVVAIAAGAYHSLAVKSDGTVVAWGYNNGGQSTIPANLTGVTNVTAGYAFSAALKNDGTLVTWGDNSYGQITIPTTATQVIHLAAGANHMMAMRADLIPAQLARLDQDNVFTGKVGIKRTPATNSLEVEGNASKTTASNWLANSDRRIKTEITSLTGALKKIDQVRLVNFRYTDDYLAAHPAIDDVRYLNVIAQEFAEVFPDHVKESGECLADGSPILQVDTYPLTIYSAAAVQELHRDSVELRRENEALKQKLNDQENRLSKLEALLENP